MAPTLPVTRLALGYPPFACDFDPQDATRLLVSGGGGANRSGVPNRITAVDAPFAENPRIAAEADLSRDEDAVNTIAIGQKKPGASNKAPTFVYAGINSSTAELEKGKNEHFRVFSMAPSSSKSEKTAHTAVLSEVSRTALFQHGEGDKETYQRLLRVSAPNPQRPGQKQVGAVATGFAKRSQIVIFEVTPGQAPKSRGVLDISREATDLDVIQTGDDSFQVAYCDEREVFVINVTKNDVTGPDLAYSMPEDGTGVQPSFRAIRYISPVFIMALSNLPRNSGVCLNGIRLPSGDIEEGRLAVSAKLPRFMTRAASFAVRNVNTPPGPGDRLGNTQFVIAVASFQAISLYTVEHRSAAHLDLLIELVPVMALKDVHPLNITSLALSSFAPPKAPNPTNLVINLASVSLNNDVAIHTIPLKKLKQEGAPAKKAGGPPRPSRYAVALAPPSKATRPLILLTVVVVILAAIAQYVLKSGVDPSEFFPKGTMVTPREGGARAVEAVLPEVLTPGEFLARLVPGATTPQEGEVYVVREDAIPHADLERAQGKENVAVPPQIKAELHQDTLKGKPAQSWDELSAEQKALWKARLEDAGHWAEHLGTGVFKGLVFSQIAGAVGQAVGG
ncbi:hypothetical protein VD0002_g8769 [Verticillium dahliae]|uniref:Guanine nucleotide-exchange factor SEC12 n=2 Tax=Verticillium dahliae TaxID=27337 RepID=G2XHN4_VERDV|nr:uncharacterized protein VDAG_09788 [Verticillium dahliae VdLs.17]KAF3344206.1 Meiotically up-regulated protein [Verticillium dahliae VDG2]KAH6704456.1 hypothetical protein EV126DRAFT_520563 [Verticillium dahliae]EGY19328.1 hypothetical protein VDAG_09788 [Verticillium dahliae VdLs.17]PNH27803.1 hypothetical protein BJF96_g8902 [Verticillium dahliae]PNH37493.1 hypothetical protein VD0004_g9298 [Verticillium dahliae]